MTISAEKIGEYLFKGGLLLAALSLVLLWLIFYPVIRSELKFIFSSKSNEVKIILDTEMSSGEINGKDEIIPADNNFSIIIPKIGANEKIIANVDPFNQAEYQRALKDGIAQANGSGLPDEGGNVFLFAHSSGNFYENSRLNTIFFLLNKLDKGNHFSIVYRGKIYNYEVFDKKIVADSQVEYINGDGKEKTATLMTCWPPGTSYKRLLVFGKAS